VTGNFFDRLAARTLGEAPVCQPILPTLFSPVSQLGVPESGYAPISEGVEVPAAAPLQLSMPEAVPSRTLSLSGDRSQQAHERGSMRREPASPGVLLPEIDDSLPQESPPAPPQIVTAAPILLAPKPEPLPRRALRLPRDSVAELAPKGRAPDVSPGSRPIVAQVIVRSTPESGRHNALHPGFTQSARGTGMGSGSEREAPVVRVTIGRVEVRAQFPPAPAAPVARRSRALALSLEDYLKQRSEGKR
jgi:hypothetical protein